MADITLTVDGKTLVAEQGKSVLEACLAGGIYLPHLCHHNALHPIGACRLCVVELEGVPGLVTSCTTLAEDGMTIRTKSAEIDAARRLSLELMLSGHQADCGTCNKYLNCELQSLKQYLITDELRVRRRSRLFGAADTNPIFTHEPNKCVLCGRCVRACQELRGVGVLFYKQSRGETYIGVGPDPDRDMSLSEAGCRFCGACAEVCPTGAILDRDEFGGGKSRKAALLPCANTCPAEIDVPRYLRFIREGNPGAAAAVVREKAPFPNVLGHVCAHPCESVCRRGQVNAPLSICRLKRFAAENDASRLWADNIRKKPETGKRVAIVGAGPAGLTAAYFLTLLGHSAVVFEAMPEPGGMLRYGIPEYRLPLTVLQSEIRDIAGLGVDIRTNAEVTSADALFDAGFDAVLLAVGAGDGVRLKLPGAKGEGVTTAADFLRAVRLGELTAISGRVMVLGGGNVAFDCARTARRLGAEVTLACLEPRGAMLCSPEELEEGEAEGVKLLPSRTFGRILREEGRVTGIELRNVLSFSFDEDRRLQLDIEEDSEHTAAADTVIFAVGQRPCVPEGFGVDLTEGGFVEADPMTMKTNREGVFAAADVVTGTDKVISAIAAGRRAAAAIDRFLGGRGKIDVRLAPEAAPEQRLGKLEGFAELERAPERRVPPEDRIQGFCAVDGGMDADAAGEEAKRCLQCDLRLMMKPEKFWSSY